jgi:hypothetical protein
MGNNKKGRVLMNKSSNRVGLKKSLLTTISRSALLRYSYLAGAGVAGVLLALPLHYARALNLYDGTQYGNDLEINLTTTLSYTGAYRVNSPSQVLAGPTNANGNDGDANFRSGVVGNLFEAVPVLDIKDGNYGMHVSGQLYLNTPYLGTNQNNQPDTINSIYNSKTTDFSSATRNVEGENAQFLDAFAFGQHQFDDGQTLALKVGRQVLFWGQSLFYASNSIAGGQAPINIVSAQNLVNPQAQQIFMPVGQAVVTYQPISGLTLQGYYQFEWEHDYFQGVGSYFSSSDILDKGGQSVIVGAIPGVGNEYFLRQKDLTPPSQNGQFGISAQYQTTNVDYGVFVERFDAKTPAIYAYAGSGVGPVSTAVANGLAVGQYQLVYPRDIWLEGVSASTTVGAANVAGEISTRQHQPLVAEGFGIPTPGSPGNGNSDPLYPVGDTWNAQLSTIYVSPALSFDPGGITFQGETIVNHLISVTDNRAALVVGHQGTAAAFDFAIIPSYYNVLPSLTLTFPVSLSYDFLGRSAVDQTLYHGNAQLDVGVSGTYKAVWIATLTYQDYLGSPQTTYNALADRGFVSLNLQHSF